MKIGIVGLGLIGGSVARAARRAGWTVYATDLRDVPLSDAQHDGVIESVTNFEKWVEDVEAVVITVPPRLVPEWIRRVGETLRPLAVVEMTSVKAPLIPYLEQLPKDFAVLSLHPMAGREVQGYQNSDADLFVGHPCAIVDIPGRLVPSAIARSFVSMMGSHPEFLTVAQHDQIVALTSHLPYLASAAILATIDGAGTNNPQWPQMVGTGFRDTTRVGASDPALWYDIISANRPEVSRLFSRFADVARRWADQIAVGDWPEELHQVRAVRKRAFPVDTSGIDASDKE